MTSQADRSPSCHTGSTVTVINCYLLTLVQDKQRHGSQSYCTTLSDCLRGYCYESLPCCAVTAVPTRQRNTLPSLSVYSAITAIKLFSSMCCILANLPFTTLLPRYRRYKHNTPLLCYYFAVWHLSTASLLYHYTLLQLFHKQILISWTEEVQQETEKKL